jgi:hypothetical protein
VEVSRLARRKKKKARSYSQDVLLVLTGSALTLCALSVMYGFLIRKSMADHEIREFRIEILNGTGEKGLARKAAALLRKNGIDVFHVDNADSFFYEESILIGRRDVDNLHVLGHALGCKNVVEQLKKDSFVDATLILGADYHTLNLGPDTNSGLLE